VTKPIDILREYPRLLLRRNAKVREALESMTETRQGFSVVVDDEGRLLGVVTDPDLRRALLRGVGVESPVCEAMNPNPVSAPADGDEASLTALFRQHAYSHVPLVDAQRKVVGIARLVDRIAVKRTRENQVILMAGGTGKRLLPLTKNTPKPMLRFGDKPVLEILLERLADSGFRRFTISVNYLADQIRSHFKDGSRWGVELDYLQEDRPLGTVGSLGLLSPTPQHPLLVVNGDVLTSLDFQAMLDFHERERALATLCVKQHEFQIPYGVVEIDESRVQSIVEKPKHRSFVNAGIYVIEPAILEWLKPLRELDMPDLLRLVRERRSDGVACFPLREDWIDIGDMTQFLRASREFERGGDAPT